MLHPKPELIFVTLPDRSGREAAICRIVGPLVNSVAKGLNMVDPHAIVVNPYTIMVDPHAIMVDPQHLRMYNGSSNNGNGTHVDVKGRRCTATPRIKKRLRLHEQWRKRIFNFAFAAGMTEKSRFVEIQ